MNQECCPTCKRPIGGRKVFEGYMADLLLICLKLADHRSVVTSKSLMKAGHTTQYARIGDLKYWGLLGQEKESWHMGVYFVTDKAIDFAKGDCTIPRSVLVYRGNVLEYDCEEITLEEAFGKRWNGVRDWVSDWRNNKRSNLVQQTSLFG